MWINLRRGMTPEEARRQVTFRLGGVVQVQQIARDPQRPAMVEVLVA